jgi:hypothetical protein
MKWKKILIIFFLMPISCMAKKESAPNNWLQEIFPSPSNCTPTNGVYYDRYKSESADRIMEKKGYVPYFIDDQIAKYKIHEVFYGLSAIEFGIPSSTSSIFTVSVNVSAKKLAENIKKILALN